MGICHCNATQGSHIINDPIAFLSYWRSDSALKLDGSVPETALFGIASSVSAVSILIPSGNVPLTLFPDKSSPLSHKTGNISTQYVLLNPQLVQTTR